MTPGGCPVHAAGVPPVLVQCRAADATYWGMSHAAQEQARLIALSRYEPLRADVQAAFEHLLQLTTQLFQVPLASLSLVDATHQTMTATCGLMPGRLSRTESLCDVVIRGQTLIATGDASQDARFARHPRVLGEPHVRFYASAPLRSPDGHVVGALCIAAPDVRPDLTGAQRDQLTALAALAMNELELQLTTRVLTRERADMTHLNGELTSALRGAETLMGLADLADLDLDPQDFALHATALTASALDVDWGGLMLMNDERAISHGAWHSPRGETFNRVASAGIRRDGQGLLWDTLKADQPLFFDDYVRHGQAHPGGVSLGLSAAASAPLGTLGDTAYLMAFFKLDRPDPWSAADRRLIRAVARTVRQALQRAQARVTLRETQARLQLALDSAPLVLWTTDLSGVITLSEGRGLASLGRRPGQSVGLSIYDLYATSPEVLAALDRVLQGEALTTQVHAGPRVMEARYEPVRNAEGKQTGMMGLGYDVTTLVDAERAARQAQGRAEALLELSQLLSDGPDFLRVAEQALEALRRALGGGWLVVWEGSQGPYRPMIRVGPVPEVMQARQAQGRGDTYAALGVLQGREVFLDEAELPAAAREDGLSGVALLPLVVQPDRAWVLGLYRAERGVETWLPEERVLVQAAARLLRAGAERHLHVSSLTHAAYTDQLTGLGNRRALEETAPGVLRDAERAGQQVTVLSLDIDGLKRVNDTEGHARGDELLITFAGALRHAVRAEDLVFRLGGDEFVVVMRHGPQGVLGEERVRAAVRHTQAAGFEEVDASVGAAVAPEDGWALESLLARSDERMYQLKVQRKRGAEPHRPR